MRIVNRRPALVVATAAAAVIPLLAPSGEARAQVARSWTRPAGGDFNVASNWNPFGAPGPSDGADFGLASTYTVNFHTDRTSGGASVGDGNVTWDLNASGAARTYTVAGLDVSGFGGSNPMLIVRDGNVNATAVRVQNGGHLHIGPTEDTGHPPATVNVTSELQIASGGRLTLLDFNSHHKLNANANVLVDGGTLRINAADSLSPGAFKLGAGRTMTIENAGSFETFGALRLQGNALHVRGGGRAFAAAGLDIATATGAGSLVVEGAGSRLSMDTSFAEERLQTWGAAGHAATIDLRGGASMSLKGAVELAPGGGAGTSARFTIDGPGTTFTQTVIGNGGAPDHIVVGHPSSGSAQLIVRNGAVFDAQAGASGSSKVLVNSTGRIDVESGATFSAVRIERAAGGQFNMRGGTVRFGWFTGNLVNEAGTLLPSRTVGSAGFVEGNFTQQTAGSLKLDIAGLQPGQAQSLFVTGNAVLGGTVELALVDDFVPIVGNTFTLLQTQFGNVGGRFARVTGTLPLPGIGLAVTYTPTQVLARASLPGDANLDNAVNLQDFNLLASNFGQSGRTWVQGDFTGDGVVNLQDFNRLAGQFGISAAADGPTLTDWANLAAVVPEPVALALPALAAIAASFRPRRRRRS